MTTVSPPQAHSAVGRVVDSTAGLSIETLLLVASSRLGDIDADVRRRIGEQRGRGDVQAAASKALTQCKGLPNGEQLEKGNPAGQQAELDKLNGSIDEAIKVAKANNNAAAVGELEKARAKLNEGDNRISKEDLAFATSALDGLIKSTASSSELEMIDIQQMMSKRAQILQITTNMLNSVNEASKGILGNIR
jgi:hypothetical protein